MAQPTPTAHLEALLFVYGEPLSMKKIAGILHIKEEAVKAAAATLEKNLADDGRGLALLRHKESLQLVTKGELKYIAEEIIKDELNATLTPAALETLSIIAYAGHISRAELEYVRGVNSSFIVRSLMLRGLIERTQDPNRANAYVYTASADLLKHLGITSISALPEHAKFQELIRKMRNPEASQEQSPHEPPQPPPTAS